MIIISIAIFSCLYDGLIKKSSTDTFADIGKLLFYIGSSADTVRSIDYEIRYGTQNIIQDLQKLNSVIQNITALHNKLLVGLDDGKDCSSSAIVTKDVIPIWTFGSSAQITQKNLFDTVQLFIENV